MSTYPGIDYAQRPNSYLEDPDALTAVLRNVQGTERQAMIRAYWQSGWMEELDDQLLAETLSPTARKALGRIHPVLMGGEYLPGYRRGEREIARIELQSMTSDVISIRARPTGARIAYRIVDEYQAKFSLGRLTSRRPLTLRDLLGLIEGSHLAQEQKAIGPNRGELNGLGVGELT